MKSYKIIRFFIMIELACILFFIGLPTFHASDQQRDLFRLTHDPIFLEYSSKILHQLQIQTLIFLLIFYVISSMFDMIFKYQKNRFKHLLFLMLSIFLTLVVAYIFATMIDNKFIRDTSSFFLGLYFSILIIVSYHVVRIIHKSERKEKTSIDTID